MTDEILDRLEPFRGKGSLSQLKKALGNDGLYDLWKLCEGSPTAGANFLGMDAQSHGHVSKAWTLLGLPITKRRPGTAEHQLEGQLVEGFRGGLTLDDWEQIWQAETSKKECAPVFHWKVKKGTEFGVLVVVSCLHYGSIGQDGPRWLKLRDWIAENPDVRWVGLGDFLNVSTKMSVSETDFIPYDIAYQLMVRHLQPISKQCFFLLDGNHETRIRRELKLRISPIREACKELQVHYGTKSTFARICLTDGKNKQDYDGYFHHGFGSARTSGGRINKLKETVAYSDVDLVALGHSHEKITSEQVRLRLASVGFTEAGRDWTEIEFMDKALLMAGSFERYLQGTYARDAGMPPASLGAVSAHLYLDRKTIHPRK